ncbi:MAG: protein-L-isoaspartate(D-aspartate) O-methyltransferase [Ignavibacteriales bacterium]|nr:protein-L-isoaspartate(D-aspartate) O-methyltransferase [Ignavibacteriales bacterium]
MSRFDEERRELVQQLRERGITDERVLEAMAKVNRHEFVRQPFQNRAYEDTALPLAAGQTISQPYTVAFMTQEIAPHAGSKILEIGTGSGYQAAVLAELECHVFTIERQMELFLAARKTFTRCGYKIQTRYGDGTIGWSEHAPYDGIMVTAAAPQIPETLLKQLGVGGRLVIPIGDKEVQSVVIVQNTPEGYTRREVAGFKFVPLIGKQGWNK